MKKSISILLIFTALVVVFTNCRKRDKEVDFAKVAKENSIAQNLFDDVFKQVDNASKLQDDSCNNQKTGQGVFVRGCATITISTMDAVFPKTIVVDFGTQNCLGNDNRYRRGKLNYTITSWYREPGCLITIVPENFYLNDNKVEGVKTITNNGRNANNFLNYTIQVNDATITTSQNNTFTWSTLRNHEWIEGETTILNRFDDVYSITGSANGITSSQISYNITINTPLNVLVGCPWVRSGTLTISIDGHNDIVVDYGNGECDANAVARYNGNEYPFVMN